MRVIDGFLVVSLFFFGVPFLIWGLNGLTPVGIAIGGLLFSIPLRLFWETFNQFVLEIKKEFELAKREISAGEWIYTVNRIILSGTIAYRFHAPSKLPSPFLSLLDDV